MLLRIDRNSPKIGGFAGNTPIEVNNWEHTGKAAYPDNTPPWNSDIWFHLGSQEGWVNFAAVRGEVTEPDPTGQASGGKPAPTPANCDITYKP